MFSERTRHATLALFALALSAATLSATSSAATTDPAPDPATGSEPAVTDPWEPVLLPMVAREYPTATAGRRQSTRGAWNTPEPRGLHWRKGQMVLQGWLGFTNYTKVSLSGGAVGPVEAQGIENMPVIGGGAQWKLNGGDKIDLGAEALINFSGRANGGAIWFGGSGGGVAVNVDMWVIEILGGAVVSKTLGKKARIYGGAGPVMQWVNYSQSGLVGDSGSGFGTGLYGRVGFEWAASAHTLVGLGARYSETKIGMGGALGDLRIEGWQYLFTITRGF
jgi:hypothetical protein